MRIAAVLLCLLLPCAAAGGALPDDAAIAAELRAYVEDARQAPAAVVGVLEAGRTRVVAYGLGDGAAVAAGDRMFEIGSISKVFTALLLAQMVDSGEVAEDQPIGSLFAPEHALREPLASITLGELATHASGLPRLPKDLGPMLRAAFSRDPYAGSTADAIFGSVAALAGADLGPKGRFAYSNLGVALLGQLLARRLGVDYETALRGRVFEPLGLAAWPLAPLPSSDPRFVQGSSRELPSRTGLASRRLCAGRRAAGQRKPVARVRRHPAGHGARVGSRRAATAAGHRCGPRPTQRARLGDFAGRRTRGLVAQRRHRRVSHASGAGAGRRSGAGGADQRGRRCRCAGATAARPRAADSARSSWQPPVGGGHGWWAAVCRSAAFGGHRARPRACPGETQARPRPHRRAWRRAVDGSDTAAHRAPGRFFPCALGRVVGGCTCVRGRCAVPRAPRVALAMARGPRLAVLAAGWQRALHRTRACDVVVASLALCARVSPASRWRTAS